MSDVRRPLGVGVVGAGWMGQVHARAFARLLHHYPELPIEPRLVAVADALPSATADFTRRFPSATPCGSWQQLLAEPAVDVVSVAAPNALHREIGTAAARAGKHLWIEKPVGLSAADVRAVADAVAAAGVQATVGFNYRNVPAVARAAQLVREGSLGTPTSAQVRLLTDYAAHPDGGLTWRFTRAHGGSGVLGDLASHGIDLVRFLLGDLERLVADTGVFVPHRPRISPGGSHYSVVTAPGGAPVGDVENEDHVSALLRTRGGARVVLEASRVAVGEQNAYGFLVHGTRGLVSWDFRRSDELVVSLGGEYVNQPSAVRFAGPGDGEYARFHPGAGIATSFDDTKVVEAAAFVRSVLGEPATGPSLEDALRSAQALEALLESARTGAWVAL